MGRCIKSHINGIVKVLYENQKDNFQHFQIVIPAKARDYGIICIGLSVCLFVCYQDKKIKRGRIWMKFFGKVPRGKSKRKFVFGYDR